MEVDSLTLLAEVNTGLAADEVTLYEAVADAL